METHNSPSLLADLCRWPRIREFISNSLPFVAGPINGIYYTGSYFPYDSGGGGFGGGGGFVL